MSYRSIVEMAASQSLIARVAACIAQEGYQGVAIELAQQKIWKLASNAEWVASWDYAVGASTVNQNPDTGARDDVVGDAMILSAVQALLASLVTPEPEPEQPEIEEPVVEVEPPVEEPVEEGEGEQVVE